MLSASLNKTFLSVPTSPFTDYVSTVPLGLEKRVSSHKGSLSPNREGGGGGGLVP